MKVIGIGNEIFDDHQGRIVEEFGGIYLGPKLAELDKFLKEEDEVIVVDSSKNFRFIVIGVKDLRPGILGYSELENYLLNALVNGAKARVTVLAFSHESEMIARCFLSCMLSRK